MADKDPLERLLVFPIGDRPVHTVEEKAECDHALGGLKKRIVILAPARSGSEYFGHVISALGVDSREYFNPASRTSNGASIGADQDERAFLVDLCGRVPNGMLCIKGGVHRVLALVRLGEFPRNIHRWSFVYLRRRNVIQQAISALVAKESDAWTSYQPKRRDVPPGTFRFDAIAAMADQIFRAEDTIERFCSLMGVSPLRIFYEDILADAPGVVAAFAHHCAIPADPMAAEVQFTKARPVPMMQRGREAVDIEARFRAELRRRLEGGGPLDETRAAHDLLTPAAARSIA